MSAASQPKWSTVKPKLAALSQSELIELVKVLFEQSADNKLCIATRLAPETLGAEAIEPYRELIVKQFFPKRGLGKLNLREARQEIRDYSKATSDTGGTLELMMIYIETGTAFTREYGDISEAFYNSLESVLGELAKILKSREGQPYYRQYAPRLKQLNAETSYIGWGYGDSVEEVVDELEAALSRA